VAGKDARLISFRLGSETFVIDIMALRQIVPYTGSTSVPTAPAFVEGIIILRNEVIPIVDLRSRLYPQLTGRESATHEQPLVLITMTSGGVIGLKVDEVRRMITVELSSILPPPPLIQGVRGEMLLGVVPYAEEIFLLMDLEHVLTGDELRELRTAELGQEAAG
jgi:purine-binding chemotaxis protein CheW